jgi:hypothetical protein
MTAILEAVIGVAVLAITTLGGLAITALRDWLKLRADAEVRAYLGAGLATAVEFGKAQVEHLRLSAAPTSPHTVAEAARDYVQDRFPDALKRFGIDTPALDEMIRARLPRKPVVH